MYKEKTKVRVLRSNLKPDTLLLDRGEIEELKLELQGNLSYVKEFKNVKGEIVLSQDIINMSEAS